MLIKKQSVKLTPYFVGLILLAMSLPLSKYTTGLFHFFLIFIWLTDGLNVKPNSLINSKSSIKLLGRNFGKNVSSKLILIWQDKTALFLISLYLIFLLSFFQGGNKTFILTPLRIKLPLLILPLVIFSMSKLSNKQFSTLLYCYIGAVLIGSLFSAYVLFSKSFTDIREISVFISPIRFALMICLAIVILIDNFLNAKDLKKWIKLIFLILTIWFIFLLFKMESGSGMLILTMLFIVFSIKKIFSFSTLR